MEINRNNYEEYFLLYADNELSPTERKVVEIFVQENVDLKEEFLMIKMTINSPEEEVKLVDKSFLSKKEPLFINENNCEEIFVLYFDNELSISQKAEVENFVTQNSKYKTEFELIGKAKLVSDNSIIYSGKKQLYKKERLRKVVPLILWRAMAAAVFIGFGLWFSISYFNKREKNISVATHINPVKNSSTEEKNIVPKEPVKEENGIASSTTTQPGKTEKEETEIKKPVVKQKNANVVAFEKPNLKIKKPIIKEQIKEAKPDVQNETIAISNPVKSTPELFQNQKNQIAVNEPAQTINKIEPEIQNTQAHAVSYVPDASADNQNFVFYDVSAEEFRKSKVGGFLKKVKRVVERNNPITRMFAGDEEQVAAK
jgi:cytoskeletal protein RodZ